MLTTEKIKNIIEEITSKTVLILGRFTPKRKAILDIIKTELRKMNLAPVIFDFNRPISRDTSETVELLARMSRFIIADVTNPASSPFEIAHITNYKSVPFCLIIDLSTDEKPFSMSSDLKKYDHYLGLGEYSDKKSLLELIQKIVTSASEYREIQITHINDEEVKKIV